MKPKWSFLLTAMSLAAFFFFGIPNAKAEQFKKAAYFAAGQRPYRLVAAKLTNSGNVDLAVADWVSNQLVILLGNGDGTFQKALKLSVPGPISLAAGDFNEDGNLDLAVVEDVGTGDGTLAIFLGDGKGGFKLSASYTLGPVSVSVAVADLNGDGHLDVAVTNKGFTGPGNMMTFFGDGHGKLRGRKVYMVAGAPFGLAIADVNGDHHPDLAVTQVKNGSVAVLLNDGAGRFGKSISYNAGGGEASDVTIADLRNDGREDLVVANLSAGLVVLLNKGNGTFGKPSFYLPCDNNCAPPESCTVADFNLDGKLDVACATHLDDSYFFYGKGKGGFEAAIPIAETIENEGGFSIAAGDFNNDGAPDLAIPIQNYGKVAILLNTK